MNHLLIVSDLADQYQDLLAQHDLPDLTIDAVTSPAAARPYLEQANLLMGLPEYLAEVIGEMPRLTWAQSTSAGVDELCRSGLRRDYQLTNAKGVFGEIMSEYVFGYILAQERNLLTYHYHQQQGEWVDYDRYPYRRLGDLTLGVIGLGSIGQCVVATGAHFGMRVLGMKRSPGEVEHVDQVYGLDELATFLPEVDYLVMVLPSTPETRHFADAEFFKLMKPDSVLLNVGRGSTLDGQALLAALDQQQLRAAVLDVVEEEPLPAESPLWRHPGIMITPHVSALSFPEHIAGIFVKHYRRFVASQPLEGLIDFERGY